MSSYLKLALFALKQVVAGVVAETVESAVKFIEQHCADNSQTLPRALAKANDRAWKTLSIALAGDGWFDQLKDWFAPGDEKALAEQVRLFLKSSPFLLDGSSAHFRKRCLAELNAARQAGLLSARHPVAKDIAKQIDTFRRFTDRQGMIEGAERVVAGIADDLLEYPTLARLLRQKTPGGPPLLVAAFAYFFRREVETNTALAHGLFWDNLRQLSASQEQAFEEVGKALTTLGQHFDQVFDQLARIKEVVVETHGAVLDMQAELQRISSVHLANADDARRLLLEVLNRVTQIGMQKGEVKPQHSLSIRSEDERNAVKQLLARFRQIPGDQKKQLPALLNGLGKLQIGSGQFEGARQSFLSVARIANQATAQAEAYFNAYRAALEEKKWPDALAAIEQAATLDSQRFAPFPLQRYQAKSILGAGGFGTAFLCQDRFFNAEIVVKTLHDTALERNMNDVFKEAQLLAHLHHPAIIGVRDCNYADVSNLARPYIVMDYFPGGSLGHFIQQRGTVSPEHLIVLAVEIAKGMHAAHQQGILHRDLKPDNVLVRKEGPVWKVKIIDFGLALRKQTIETSIKQASAANTILGSSVAGTVKYAPPEQMGELRGVKSGPYSDVYSFGKLCCYSLFKTTEPTDRHWSAVPGGIRTGLKAMLDQCREPELAHRFPGFEPVLKALQYLTPSKSPQMRLDPQEGETQLAHLVWAAFDRTQGNPTEDDTAAANEIRKRYGIPSRRAREIVEELRKKWQENRATVLAAVSATPAQAHPVFSEAGRQKQVPQTGNRPALPNKDVDKDYHEYVFHGGWIAVMSDQQRLNGPMPRHPEELISECQRLMSSDFFNPSKWLFTWQTTATACRRRFQACLMMIEKWAYYYPEYRSAFVNLWNETATVFKADPIEVSYFQTDSIRQKYGVPQ